MFNYKYDYLVHKCVDCYLMLTFLKGSLGILKCMIQNLILLEQRWTMSEIKLFLRRLYTSFAYFSPPIAIDTPSSRSRESGDPTEVTPGNSDCGTTPRHQTDSGIAGRLHTSLWRKFVLLEYNAKH